MFVDARWTRVDGPDGIGRYCANLVEALHELHPVTMLVHDERQLSHLPSHVPHVFIHNPLSPRELLLHRTLHGLGADVVFSPMQVIGGVGRRHYTLLLTLHDLIYYRHPEPPGFLPLPVRVLWRIYHRAFWPQRLLLNRADAVVTVSETTKRLIAQHRLTKRPVHVIPNAPTAPPAQCANSDEEEPSRPVDLVYMGTFMPYKNVETLIAGMSRLSGYRLHLLSRLDPAREAELTAAIPPGADVVFWRGIDEQEYHRLLAGAGALVTASKDEGFGLPVIEAMHAGAPVVCSDLEIFQEVTGGNAIFFDPHSPAAFVAAVRELSDEQRRSRLVAAARKRAEEFNWNSSAERLLGLMHSHTRH